MSNIKKIAPSILSADFANLKNEIMAVADSGADYIHVDVMDGHFVPNITIGPVVVSSLKKISPLPLDVHLMIENPEKYIEPFAKAGADIITVHIEATDSPKELLQQIKKLGVKAGITLRPGTAISAIEPFLDYVDLVLVMTVEPGFGGQSFMKCQVEKINKLAQLRGQRTYLIEVDGGINPETAQLCSKADILVAGSYIYKHNSYKEAIDSLKNA